MKRACRVSLVRLIPCSTRVVSLLRPDSPVMPPCRSSGGMTTSWRRAATTRRRSVCDEDGAGIGTRKRPRLRRATKSRLSGEGLPFESGELACRGRGRLLFPLRCLLPDARS